MATTVADLPGRLTDPDVMATYAVDATIGATVPSDFEVVRATCVEDVVEVMRFAAARGMPVVPQGARTALTGAACAVEGGIVLNTEKLATIHEIDPVEGIAVMGPGVVTGDLRRVLAESGLFYPPDPGSLDSCTIGGNVAMNAGGMCCVKYGVTEHYVRGLEVVLPGGELLRTGRRTAKGVTGYDLTGLFVGSEGTLGVVTKVVTRVVPLPDPALTALATFDSLAAASEAIVALRMLRHTPSLLEFLDEPSIVAIQALGDFGFPRAARPRCWCSPTGWVTSPRMSSLTPPRWKPAAQPTSPSPMTSRRPTCCWPAAAASIPRWKPRAPTSSRTCVCPCDG